MCGRRGGATWGRAVPCAYAVAPQLFPGQLQRHATQRHSACTVHTHRLECKGLRACTFARARRG